MLANFYQRNQKLINFLVGTCLILAFIIKFRWTYLNYRVPNPLRTFGYSEFLINFQGGFVRRGLVGEYLYQIYSVHPYPVITVISVLSYVVFFAVLVFFFYKFHKKKYCWWILFSPLFLGYTNDIVRKDYILFCIIICMLYGLHKVNASMWKLILACILVTLGLFLHEAFIFWGFPIYAVIVLSKHSHRLFAWIMVCIPIAVFGLFSIYKGNTEVAHKIVDSWNALIPGEPLSYASQGSSIGALGWEIQNTFLFHLKKNINFSNGGYGVVLLPLYLFSSYYMFSNFLSVFSKKSVDDDGKDKFAISLVYSITAICMIPMFTVLSCDTGRNFQYISVVTFATILIIPTESIISAFPRWYKRIICKFNSILCRLLTPTKVLMIIMLLFIGMSPWYFSISTCLSNSIIGTICKVIIKLF